MGVGAATGAAAYSASQLFQGNTPTLSGIILNAGIGALAAFAGGNARQLHNALRLNSQHAWSLFHRGILNSPAAAQSIANLKNNVAVHAFITSSLRRTATVELGTLLADLVGINISSLQSSGCEN